MSMIVAYDSARGIGANNKLPWYIPADLMRFKKITMGKNIIMGRKTFESIGRALPGRTNIVVSKNQYSVRPESMTTISKTKLVFVSSLEEAYNFSNGEFIIIGGGSIYEQSIEKVNTIYATEVNTITDADVFFPRLDDAWVEILREKNIDVDYSYDFVTYKRKN